MVVLGFDPGGQESFGWCVAEAVGSGELTLRDHGLASHAGEAVRKALDSVGERSRIKAAGIDSPLFWIADGDRNADKVVRSALRRYRAGSTVQHVNSLQGACLVQGILTAYLLRQALPAIRITESHPKALLWLLALASKGRPVGEVAMWHLADLVRCDARRLSEHVRDAALGAVAALAMIEKRVAWCDLYRRETKPFAPISPVEYWMPIEEPH